MGWINSDDCLGVGALISLFSVAREFPHRQVFTGRITLMHDNGAIIAALPAVPYGRETLQLGLHDHRSGLPFVQQEGTFWRPSIWHKAGGLDESFKLAGDWDLWRRMAAYADFTTVDMTLGLHREREGRLSADLTRYYAEIDKVREGSPPETLAASSDAGIVRYDAELGRWVCHEPSLKPSLKPSRKPKRKGNAIQRLRYRLVKSARKRFARVRGGEGVRS